MGLLKKRNVQHDRSAIDEAAAKLGIEGVEGDDETAIRALRAAFEERLKGVPSADWIVCPKCGEHTDDDEAIEKCPYCGSEGDDEALDDDPDADEPADLATLEEEAGEEAPEPEEPPVADLSNSTETEIMESPEPEEEPAKPAKAPRAKKAKPEKAKAEKAKAEKAEPDAYMEGILAKTADGAESTAIVAADQASPSGSMADSLGEWKARIEAAQTDMVGGSYDLGHALKAIHDGEYWKAEGHKHFNKFLASIGVSRAFAYDMMEIAAKFDRATFLDVGRSKLSIVARAEKEDRGKLLEDAKGGASRRELESKSKEGKGKSEKPAKEPKEPKAAPAKESTGEVTLLTKVGGRASTVKWKDRATKVEVPEWTPDSFAEVRISEGVVQFIALKTDAEGKIVGVTLAYRRAEEVEKK